MLDKTTSRKQVRSGDNRLSVYQVSADEKLEHIYQTLATLMTKDDLVFQMNKLREEIGEENREMVQRLECRVFELETENDKLRDTIEQLENSVELSVERIVQLTLKDNSLEQQGRKNSVRIVGLPNDRNETAEACIDKCAKFFRDYLNVDIESTDIDIAHRLGPQSTICKFTRRIKKFEVLKARRNLKGKKISIFEDLTQETRESLNVHTT
ncbi:ribonuclease Y-like [Argopecten irradians]|uniref:ribonuclease Y-like n=1 Tax=Argopecten irradians TaxID=31199 RepID=UPI00371E4826